MVKSIPFIDKVSEICSLIHKEVMEFTATAAGLITPIRKVLLGVFLWRTS